ncbi:MAG: hypothetical protein AB7T18_02330 [Alphaproteobacteria bacterium]
MSAPKLPGFTADRSLAPARGRYRSGNRAASRSSGVVPAIPMCSNCDYILDRCEQNGWRPRALCAMCATGDCWDPPPPPDPFPNPWPTPPWFSSGGF